MTDKDDEQELAMIAARAAEIKTGLDAAYSVEELRRPLSTRSVHALIAGVTASTAAKLKALSARVEQLENGGIRYAGTWQRALPYGRGSVVTSGGGMWAALRDTSEGERPGDAPDAWQLAAKAARPVVRSKATGQQ
ncbi:transposase [Rhizobium ruizarguesonis]|uniref:transposase n=1 Tax=Rhizobium ruizarguesonis TaxID=2081791 RepID=UPI001031E2CA|nr:transposase [Rhizobium ruizarguesonis]TAZ95009.1 transposase [Rhizobium ruizarguesonis]TBA37889.1 transposase [Rhizobium ruizarguesonis]TBC63245.1 transposase [Rhizobium ruizarguesonis]